MLYINNLFLISKNSRFCYMGELVYLYSNNMVCKLLFCLFIYKTRGPRGPWVAHLRKRSKATVQRIIENPRGIIWTTLVEDLLMLFYIKYESTSPCSFRQEDFWKLHFKTYLLTCDLFMQPTGTVWTTLIGDHPGIIPVKFGQIPISGSREDVVWTFPYIIQCKIVTLGAGSILTPRA